VKKKEDPDMNLPNYTHLILDQAKIMMENRQPLQQMFLGKLDICMQKTETKFMRHPVQIPTQGGSRTLI
jgi:hypothetical protein